MMSIDRKLKSDTQLWWFHRLEPNHQQLQDKRLGINTRFWWFQGLEPNPQQLYDKSSDITTRLMVPRIGTNQKQP